MTNCIHFWDEKYHCNISQKSNINLLKPAKTKKYTIKIILIWKESQSLFFELVTLDYYRSRFTYMVESGTRTNFM